MVAALKTTINHQQIIISISNLLKAYLSSDSMTYFFAKNLCKNGNEFSNAENNLRKKGKIIHEEIFVPTEKKLRGNKINLKLQNYCICKYGIKMRGTKVQTEVPAYNFKVLHRLQDVFIT